MPPPQRSATRRNINRPNNSHHEVSTNMERPKQGMKVVYEDAKPEVDIIFVPGLGADPEKCWAAPASNSFNWVLSAEGIQQTCPRSRILLYMTLSAWLGKYAVQTTIQSVSETLLDDVRAKREKESERRRPIVFVGHSMGGLIVAKALLMASNDLRNYPYIAECTAGCAFFGTPFGGAPAAGLLSIFAHGQEHFNERAAPTIIDQMTPNNPELQELKEGFVNFRGKWDETLRMDVICFYEQANTDLAAMAQSVVYLPRFMLEAVLGKPRPFVDQESAKIFGIKSAVIGADHRGMVQFKGVRDEQYIMVRDRLMHIIKGAKLLIDKRFNSTRNVDNKLVQDVCNMLEGSQTKKRNALNAKSSDNQKSFSSWLTEEPEYLNWLNPGAKSDPDGKEREEKSPTLWIRGPVGRGKTNNMLAVLDHIDKAIEEGTRSGGPQHSWLVAYYFCESNATESTADMLMRSLIHQLISQRPALAPYAKHFVKKGSRHAVPMTVENMWQTLQDLLNDELLGTRVYFVISNIHFLPTNALSTIALMERMRPELEIGQGGGQRTRPVQAQWFITSRETIDIKANLMPASARLIDLEADKYSTKAQLVLWKHAQSRVSQLKAQKHYNKALAYFATNSIKRRAQNIHWIDVACLHLRELRVDESDMKIRHMLQVMPDDLEALLDHAWRQIFSFNEANAEKIKEILRVLVITFENPTDRELAMLGGLDSTGESDAEFKQLVGACRPLIVVKSNRVKFMNDVVKNHLVKSAEKHLGLNADTFKWYHGVLTHRCFSHCQEKLQILVDLGDKADADADADAADTNVIEQSGEEEQTENVEASNLEDATAVVEDTTNDYYDLDDYDEDEEQANLDACVNDLPEDGQGFIRLARQYIYDYPVKYWLRHASEATADLADELVEDTDFWEPESKIRQGWLAIYLCLTGSYDIIDSEEDLKLPAMHVAAAFGFDQLIKTLVENGHQDELTQVFDGGMTPLHMSAFFGNASTAEQLLKHKVDVNSGRDDHSETPLELAAARGNLDLMTMLINSDADVNAYSKNYYNNSDDSEDSSNESETSENGESEADAEVDDDDNEIPEDNNENNENSENNENNENNENESLDQADDENSEEEKEDEGEFKFWPVINSAITSGNPEAVRLLVKNNASLAPQGDDMDRPLALAAQYSEPAMFDYLLNTYGTMLPQKEYDEAFVAAAEAGRQEVLAKLLPYNPSQESFQRALDGTIDDTSWDVAKYILQQRPGLNCENSASSTAKRPLAVEGRNAFEKAVSTTEDQDDLLRFMWNYTNKGISREVLEKSMCLAVKLSKLSTLELLVKEFKVDINADEPEYGTALTVAAEWNNMEIIDFLLANDVDVNDSIGYPLHIAAKKGYFSVVEKLLQSGADVNRHTTFTGFTEGTALQAACAAGWDEIAGLLLSKAADPNKGNGALTCPLIAAVENGQSKIVSLLLADPKTDVFVRGGPRSCSPLVSAARTMPCHILKQMVDAGVSVNETDFKGNTALIVATAYNDAECVEYLLGQGVDVWYTNHANKNALQVATEEGSGDCLRVLVDHISGTMNKIRAANGPSNVASFIKSFNAIGCSNGDQHQLRGQISQPMDSAAALRSEQTDRSAPLSQPQDTVPDPRNNKLNETVNTVPEGYPETRPLLFNNDNAETQHEGQPKEASMNFNEAFRNETIDHPINTDERRPEQRDNEYEASLGVDNSDPQVFEEEDHASANLQDEMQGYTDSPEIENHQPEQYQSLDNEVEEYSNHNQSSYVVHQDASIGQMQQLTQGDISHAHPPQIYNYNYNQGYSQQPENLHREEQDQEHANVDDFDELRQRHSQASANPVADSRWSDQLYRDQVSQDFGQSWQESASTPASHNSTFSPGPTSHNFSPSGTSISNSSAYSPTPDAFAIKRKPAGRGPRVSAHNNNSGNSTTSEYPGRYPPGHSYEEDQTSQVGRQQSFSPTRQQEPFTAYFEYHPQQQPNRVSYVSGDTMNSQSSQASHKPATNASFGQQQVQRDSANSNVSQSSSNSNLLQRQSLLNMRGIRNVFRKSDG